MSEFKYLHVVDDGTNNVTNKPKEAYEIVNYQFRDNKTLIKPLHGTSIELAAQKYLFEHPREFFVYVENALPEYKYEKVTYTMLSRNPAMQLHLKQESEDLKDI